MKTIYLIDDDDIFNTLNSAIIKFVDEEYKIVIFKSGKEVLTYLKKNTTSFIPPEIVFLDIRMPNVNGFELLDILAEMKQHPFEKSKVFMLSSTLNEKDLERTKAYPIISAFLGKPLTIEVFTNLLKEM